ncbi:MAG TPA: zf-HC2 domain-containing protein [Candidatus Sulfotelmatobacter sp.]|nr:zf-HC2 domain-containing protein [Candidatus Sulfotelmatobacter sp.]
MHRGERLDHQRFKELAALAQRGTLSESERLELDLHLQTCSSCRQALEEYSLIGTEGMDFLAAAYGHTYAPEAWDDGPSRDKLMSRIRAAEPHESRARAEMIQIDGAALASRIQPAWLGIAAAACVLLGVSVGAYELVGHVNAHIRSHFRPVVPQQQVADGHKQFDDLIVAQKARLDQLQTQADKSQREVVRLWDALRAAENRSTALTAANHERADEIRQVTEERDKLADQLREAEESYRLVQAELTNLRAEHDRVLLHTASLQSKIDELTAAGREQERHIQDDEQYLASDRDIRELMGARKLYIADVFDVDSGSRTRKPFGRVFYTQNKSLIFYAFDLDHQPGVKTASAFQVWGQRDAEAGEKNRAMNLGILYMDSETNRRWVLRLDDQKQLADIDAVFVTVEPHGGSQKPTGKPFLYALLRKEANHP